MELDDFSQGYLDGRDLNTPYPNENRSYRYRHSWNIGRMEKLNLPMPSAQVSSRAAYLAECRDGVA